MHIFFIDDSIQRHPNRPKMGQMVAVGGVVCLDQAVNKVEEEIEKICTTYGFPPGERFKWSPGDELWMRKGLVEKHRYGFQRDILQVLQRHDCRAIFIAEDSNCKGANSQLLSNEMDLAMLLIERADWFFEKQDSIGAIVVDRPGGGFKKEEAFLLECLDALRSGSQYRKPSRVVLPVLSAPSTTTRLLQTADLIAGCTLAYVCGEQYYSPPLMEFLTPLFLRVDGRIGGVGVKLHPYVKYANLYHWLFGDTHYVKMNMGFPMPLDNIAFSKSLDEY